MSCSSRRLRSMLAHIEATLAESGPTPYLLALDAARETDGLHQKRCVKSVASMAIVELASELSCRPAGMVCGYLRRRKGTVRLVWLPHDALRRT